MIKFTLVGLSGVVVNFFCYRLLVVVPGWTVWGEDEGAGQLEHAEEVGPPNTLNE